ncbi:MAG: hypothetical protein HYZ57_16425 [Acidobacteria bacterium]|nr:hypothetical protein [Acidobacteriota bacterium]MBI3281418.1 hypothetical protein [Acidobacteriota bacterium]
MTFIERGWQLGQELLFFALLTTALALVAWWYRERLMARQQRGLRVLMALAEEVVSAQNPSEIAKRLAATLPSVLTGCSARLYLYNRTTNALDRVPQPQDPEPESISTEAPLGPLPFAIVLCYRNQALFSVPDLRRSPLMKPADRPERARSAVLAPLLVQSLEHPMGVLSIEYPAPRESNAGEQAAVQHLANQVAISLKLQEQHSMREQLMRSEKTAAAGQLISGVANELNGPLESISRLANELLDKPLEDRHITQLQAIAFEARRGSEIINHLVSFTEGDQNEASPIDLHQVAHGLVGFRQREWDVKGIQARNLLASSPLMVMGGRTQIEQMMLNLLVHAEQSLTEEKDKAIVLGSRRLPNHALITIDFTDRHAYPQDSDPFGESGKEAFGLQVCQSIAQSHGGRIRLLRGLPSGSRFEVELPYAEAAEANGDARPEHRPGRRLTVIVVEPDQGPQRRLLSLLSERGHRVLPLGSAEEAIDMVQRFRFDAVFCAVRLPGLSWVDLYQRVRSSIGAFALVTEGRDTDTSRVFQGTEAFLLSKPVQDQELDRLLARVDGREQPASAG